MLYKQKCYTNKNFAINKKTRTPDFHNTGTYENKLWYGKWRKWLVPLRRGVGAGPGAVVYGWLGSIPSAPRLRVGRFGSPTRRVCPDSNCGGGFGGLLLRDPENQWFAKGGWYGARNGQVGVLGAGIGSLGSPRRGLGGLTDADWCRWCAHPGGQGVVLGSQVGGVRRAPQRTCVGLPSRQHLRHAERTTP